MPLARDYSHPYSTHPLTSLARYYGLVCCTYDVEAPGLNGENGHSGIVAIWQAREWGRQWLWEAPAWEQAYVPCLGGLRPSPTLILKRDPIFIRGHIRSCPRTVIRGWPFNHAHIYFKTDLNKPANYKQTGWFSSKPDGFSYISDIIQLNYSVLDYSNLV